MSQNIILPAPQSLYGPPTLGTILPTIFLYTILPIIILVGFFIFLGKRIKKKEGTKENKQGKKIEKK